MRTVQAYCRCLIDPALAPTAARVAVLVGTVLLLINHGAALAQGNMTRQRWFSAGITYLVPYGVNIHGQFSYRQKHSGDEAKGRN
ncbi:MAG: nitrate/nitrite transporter NrtS [Synechococcaceae cyanobacterium SM2_3_1]|nr:nitrate/nitrite transporter NrtS [Synechococcaceae cyanobacterium SM2_3_1]